MDERDLIARVRQGDAVAERELYEAHVDRVYRLAYRMTGDSAIVWPALIDVARDGQLPRRTRRVALQWVGMAAGDVVTDGQAVVDDADRVTREQAVFAVSQLPKDEGVPLLIEVARSHRDPQVRRRALFWLGQSGDARAIDVFEELLRGR